jgi:hypothetical protein
MLKQLCAGRIAFGGTAILAPARFGRGWVGKDANSDGFGVFARAMGVRDLGIGAGTLQALKSGNREALHTWLVVGLAADAVDLGATLVARERLPRHAVPMLAVMAGSAIVTQALNLAADDTPAPA